MKSTRVIIGDCLDVLADLPAGSVQCVVTSPPYLGLRDYQVPPSSWPAIEFSPMPGLPPVSVPAMSACLGLEPDPWAFVGHLVEVFRRVRRVLRDDGVAFVNLGDSYAATGKSGGGDQGKRWESCGADTEGPRGGKWSPAPKGLKPKDLIGIPWRVAFALQADGWFLRQDVIWSKPNPMPESVRDRCTKAHEYVFLLAKSERYFWDSEAIKEPVASGPSDIRKMLEAKPRIGGKHKTLVDPLSKASSLTNIGQKRSVGSPDGRNKRSVWPVATAPYSGAHYAVMPAALVEPCILAGSRPGDAVLDPFGGTGTVGSVAAYHDRRAVLIDINPANEALMGERLEKHEAPLFDGLARPVQEALI